MSLSIGVDVGGTFTDLIAVDEAGGVRVAKVPTTVDDQSKGFTTGLGALGFDRLEAVDLICHGTTTGTNAVLERKGARCGLVTTRGFRDTLELAQRTRPHNYGLFGSYTPLIPRDRRLEVDERMDARGEVVTPLDEEQLLGAVQRLLDMGVESLLIAFLHSYVNPDHERRALELALEAWPNPYVTASHRVLAQFREFERLSTAAVNAYIQPPIDRYLRRLVDGLRSDGYRNDLMIMRSNGGVVRENLAARLPVQTVLSGPAAGVTAAAGLCSEIGYGNAISADVGGTSFDVAMIVDGVPVTSSTSSLAYGIPVRVPMIDIHTIGAGGGSIAQLDGMGLLRVGPESAGADPGPVAYGRGGTLPTLTDASLVLGRLSPERMIGLDRPVDMAAVRAALVEHVATPLGLDVEEAAAAVVRVANDRMAAAVRSVSLARGHDPREFAYFAFGGGGALNAVEIARELSIPTVIVPYRLGITSAIGTLVAQVRHDFVQTVNRPAHDVAVGELAAIIEDFTAQGRTLLEEQGVALVDVHVWPQLELQYEGQTHTVPVEFAGDETWDVLADRFTRAYEEAYGALPGATIPHKVVNVRCAVVGVRHPIDLAMVAAGDGRAASVAEAAIERRPVAFPDGWRETPVLRRERVPLGATLRGPAVIEQQDGTTVMDAGCTADVDRSGNLIVHLGSTDG